MDIKTVTHIRNFVFGVEDSLVSTVGLLSGVAAAGTSPHTIVLAGIVLISVEAFSMGAGSLLSEHSAQEAALRKEVPLADSLKSAAIMFLSYFFAGFIPLSPYLFLPVSQAFSSSIGASLIALFILGAVSGKMAGMKPLRPALQMLVIGGAAIALGVSVGTVFG